MKKGQKLVCNRHVTWRDSILGFVYSGPRFNEIVTCSGISPLDFDFILLEEYPYVANTLAAFPKRCFEPLVSDEVLERELSSIFEKP